MASNDIKHMSDRDHCRIRSGTYIGGSEVDEKGRNSESLITIIREASDNSVDEVKLGNGDTIWIAKEKVNKPNVKFEEDVSYIKNWYSYLVGDNCGGIPIKKTENPKGEEVTMTDLAVENFRAGSKFDVEDRADVDYIGMNGIGVSATNFTSAQFIIYSHLSCHDLSETTTYVKELVKKNKITKANSDDWYYKLSFEFGLKTNEELVKFSEDEILQKFAKQKCRPSTVTWFIPDPQIHNTTDADVPVTFRYMKYLHPEHKFYLNWKEDKDLPPTFAYKDVVVEKLDIDEAALAKMDPKQRKRALRNSKLTFTFSIEPVKDLKNEPTQDFSVNTLSTQEGVHKKLFVNAWVNAFCGYFKDLEIQKYAMMGLNVLCIMQCSEPEFNGQTKQKLSGLPGWKTTEVLPKLVKSFTRIISENEEIFKKYYEDVSAYFAARQNIGKLKELKKQLSDVVAGNKSSSSYLPKKLLDCPCKDRTKAEVFFTEGLSAAGALAKARAGLDYVAIMPLRGKIRNTIGEKIEDSLKNEEIADITNACGGVDDVHLPLEKLHFWKYIIATDADADGYQIGALLLGDFMQNHKFLFGTKEKNYEDSRVYIAVAPLFAFFGVDGKKDVKKYFYSGQEALAADFAKNHKYKSYKRYKGLGELNPDELKDMYLNPENRKLVKVTLENIEDAMEIINPKNKQSRKDLMIEKGVYCNDLIILEKK